MDKPRYSRVVVLQLLAAAVQERVRLERAGVGAGDGIGQRPQVLLRRALVRTEVAVVFPGERGAEVVFKLAGRADDQGLGADLPQQILEQLKELRRESAA